MTTNVTDFSQNGIIQQYEAQLDEICELLDEVIVAIAGPAAEWDAGAEGAGIDRAATYVISGEQLFRLAVAREGANSVLAWVDGHTQC